MEAQLELFVDAGRIASLEDTIVDLGLDTARALEARIAEGIALRARLGTVERLFLDQCKINSSVGDRLRVLETRAGIRTAPSLPPLALSREVAAA